MDTFAPNNDITFFAETNFRGQRKRFGIKREDRRKHVYIIGKTGMGKSTLLENMTIQDIQRGRGVAVVDPHGEYADRMLDFVPSQRVNDVIYFNPADTAHPVAFNIMERVGEDQRHLVSSGLLGVFKKIWPDVWSPRMEYLLANAILALLEIPGSTLLGVNRMFGEKEFRKRIVSQLRDPVIKGFWENEFAKYPEQFMREAVAAIQNKVGQFASNPLIRNIIGQVESAVDMRRVMDEEKIFIVNIAKGRIGEENSRLLGAMLVTKLYLEAMGRVDIPESERKDFYLYVDEFQNFATESFANILSEARKYRLNLTVAHQYIFQMEEMVQHAIFGNVGTMIAFRVGAEDAELFEKEFSPEFMLQDLVNLGFTQAYVKLMIDGITSRPFSAETLPPFPPPAESHREKIIEQSRERYGTSRGVVEEKIRRFTQGSGGEEAADANRPVSAPEPVGISVNPSRPLYQARCAEDGKVVMVPFQPDGRRPVYCEEHMHLVKFRSRASEPMAQRVGRGEAPATPQRQLPPQPKPAPKPLPLREQRRDEPPRGQPEGRAQPAGPRERAQPAASRREPQPKVAVGSEEHLVELRRVLEASLRNRGPTPATPGDSAERPPQPGEPPAARRSPQPQNDPRILQPGETVRFE